MAKGTFRFYEELNDFLPEHRKKIDFEAEFNGRKSIKDIIEKCGVPSTEVDLVLIIGKSIREKRIILTKRKELLKSKSITHGMLIRPGTAVEQVKYIIDNLDIKDRIKPFSKCLRCNGLLESEFTGKSLNRISPVTTSGCEKDILCKFCDENQEV